MGTTNSFGLSHGSALMQLLRSPAVTQVIVKNEKGQNKTYDVGEEETVAQLQRKIYNKERVPEDQQRLIHNGRQMEAGMKLKDYNVTNGSIIYLTLRLRGG
uniref:ISG15 ubiquitin like modifier n=1 Tax=Astyanax mexicanus TaxID=7994 RepID=A0A8B9JVG8_ASTMX